MTYRHLISSSAAIFTIGVLLTACSNKTNDQNSGEEPQTVDVMLAVVAPTSMTVELPGKLEAFRQAEVRARVAGIVTERLYTEGEDVKKGTPLFLINPELLTAARDQAAGTMARAEASLTNATDKLARYKDLATDHSISDRDYQSAIAEELQAKAELLTAKAQLDKAKLDLGYSKVTSPIDGRARRALVTEGALVGQDSSTPLTTVEQINPIYVNFSQPASDVMAMQRAIKAGQLEGVALKNIKVDLIFSDGTKYSKPGKLFFSDLAVDTNTDTVAMRALFENSEHDLLPGAYVQVRIEQAINKNTVLIPRDALVRTAGGASVMVVNGESKVEVVNVIAEKMQGKNWIVTKGLQGGERLIITNPGMLVPGSQVKASADKKAETD